MEESHMGCWRNMSGQLSHESFSSTEIQSNNSALQKHDETKAICESCRVSVSLTISTPHLNTYTYSISHNYLRESRWLQLSYISTATEDTEDTEGLKSYKLTHFIQSDLQRRRTAQVIHPSEAVTLT